MYHRITTKFHASATWNSSSTSPVSPNLNQVSRKHRFASSSPIQVSSSAIANDVPSFFRVRRLDDVDNAKIIEADEDQHHEYVTLGERDDQLACKDYTLITTSSTARPAAASPSYPSAMAVDDYSEIVTDAPTKADKDKRHLS